MQKASRPSTFQPINEVLTPWINTEYEMWNSDILNLVDNSTIQTITKSHHNSCELQNRSNLHSQKAIERKFVRRPLSLCQSACEQRQKVGRQSRIRKNEKIVNKNSKYFVKASFNAEQDIFLSTKAVNLKLKVVKMFESSLQPIRKEQLRSLNLFDNSVKALQQKTLQNYPGRVRQDIQKKWLKIKASKIISGKDQIKNRQFERNPIKHHLLRFYKQKCLASSQK